MGGGESGGAKTSQPVKPVTPDQLAERVKLALKQVRQRDLLTTNSFWTVFHGILGMGPGTELVNPDTRERVNAIDYISKGGVIRGLEFIPSQHGLDVRLGPQFVGQGHQDQYVAEMAQWGMEPSQKFVVNGKEYTFEDFIRHSQMRSSVKAQPKQELSWAIIMVAQFRGTNVSWENEKGEKLHFDDVVRYELNEPIEEHAACGGTHRLFGLTWAYHLHIKGGGKKTGVWVDVAKKIEEYKLKARVLQNADGSFSTRYLAGPGNVQDVQLRIGTTGHVLEWLALALTDDELRQPWVQNAANALAMMILENQGVPVESGALYHAAHGLHIYHARVWGLSSDTPKALLFPLPPQDDRPTPRP
jgi:hypothetical protein